MTTSHLSESPAQTEFTICNSDLVQVPYSTVLRAIEDTDSDPFTMTIRCEIEWSSIAMCVNQGIDSHLQAICVHTAVR